MRAKLLGIVLTTPIAISSFASTETLSFTPDNINADISLGTLSGKTKERVYLAEEGGRKVSQLDWKFNNAAIIKGAINWDLMPRYLSGLLAGQLSAAEVAIWSIRTGWIPVTPEPGRMKVDTLIHNSIMPTNLI
ncbi:omptin family outer membrane protease [Escherichia coli]|nr:omptin family outer membrane protease [Escherichia coli]EFE7288373.1 omptin family outer membrane protease [Escherichia coli]EFF1814583.1 omptin family outer membrane protease [Escherichia coli]EFH3420560.1 omptin family outer membrane protease [Escherichia coli]EFM4660858.1 omptin family outer membrane protease [Escherichia coli]